MNQFCFFCWSWWWAYPGRCVCCTEPPLYAARCRCPLRGRVQGLCMCASAGSARHHRAPYTVTMMTSKTRHLSLNRPDTHIHDTHTQVQDDQASRETQTTGHMDKQTLTQRKQDAVSEHRDANKRTWKQADRQKQARQSTTEGEIRTAQLQCWQTNIYYEV